MALPSTRMTTIVVLCIIFLAVYFIFLNLSFLNFFNLDGGADRARSGEVPVLDNESSGSHTKPPPPPSPLALLQQERDYQAFFCSDLHPIPMDPNAIAYYENIPLIKSDTRLGMYLFKQGDIVSNSIIRAQTWERTEVGRLIDMMDKAKSEYGVADPVFLDIGSNVGWFTVNMAGRGYKTLSFDALRNNGHLFRSTLCRNPELMERVTFVNKGLSDVEKVCLVISENSNQGDGNTVCPEGNLADYKPTGKYVIRNEIHLVRLDRYVQQDVFVVKIDVEGFEFHVLKGAEKLLNEHNVPFIQSEVSATMMRQNAGSDPMEYFDFLSGLGYQISFDGFDGEVVSRDRFQTAVGGQFLLNMFCRKNGTTKYS